MKDFLSEPEPGRLLPETPFHSFVTSREARVGLLSSVGSVCLVSSNHPLGPPDHQGDVETLLRFIASPMWSWMDAWPVPG